MRIITAQASLALQQPSVAIAQLLLMEFASGTVALNTTNWDLTWGGVTYKGAGAMGTIEPITNGPGEVKGLQFSLSGVFSEYLALALDDAAEWQGATITIRTALFGSDYQIVDAPVEWVGTGDTMNISEDGETAIISATSESKAVDLLRGTPLTYSDADQRSLYPDDYAFQYVASQVDQPVVWPAKEWFYK